MNNEITPQCILVRKSSVFASKIDEETVMMDEEESSYFGLNPVAGKIWELLEKPTSFSGLVDQLTASYQVDRQRCENDIRPFLEKLVSHHLIRKVNE